MRVRIHQEANELRAFKRWKAKPFQQTQTDTHTNIFQMPVCVCVLCKITSWYYYDTIIAIFLIVLSALHSLNIIVIMILLLMSSYLGYYVIIIVAFNWSDETFTAACISFFFKFLWQNLLVAYKYINIIMSVMKWRYRSTVEPLYSGHPWDSLKCPD
jgi:hypothetical protein